MTIYEKAVKHYGADSQISKAIEEMAELMMELARYQNGEDNVSLIGDEIADVKIMLEQLIVIFGSQSFVNQSIGTKLHRLENRMKQSKWRD